MVPAPTNVSWRQVLSDSMAIGISGRDPSVAVYHPIWFRHITALRAVRSGGAQIITSIRRSLLFMS